MIEDATNKQVREDALGEPISFVAPRVVVFAREGPFSLAREEPLPVGVPLPATGTFGAGGTSVCHAARCALASLTSYPLHRAESSSRRLTVRRSRRESLKPDV